MAEYNWPDTQHLNNAKRVERFSKCKRCGDDKVTWHKSQRTGKWYLCDVQKTDSGSYWELQTYVHKCGTSQADSDPDPYKDYTNDDLRESIAMHTEILSMHLEGSKIAFLEGQIAKAQAELNRREWEAK